MSHSLTNTDTVSVSAAEEDAAMTLLNARNLFMRGDVDTMHEWTKGRAGVSSDSSRSKRTPKPAKHRNDLDAYDSGPLQRKRTPPTNNRKTKDLEWMERHLETVVIGKSGAEPPELDSLLKFHDSCRSEQNQAPLRQGYFQVVDMEYMSQSQLLMMAEATQNPICMPPVLPQRAGIDKNKAASFSGQDAFYKEVHAHTKDGSKDGSKKRHGSSHESPLAVSSDEEKMEMAERIQNIWKQDNNQVWKIVGRSEPPIVNRIQINYLRLFLVVEDFGGYQHALENKKWSDIARKFGMEESNIGKNGHSLRMLYLQYIKPLTLFLRA